MTESTALTQQQIEQIERIVDARIALAQSRGPRKGLKPYHTTLEIRALIEKALPSLQERFGAREFDIAVLRFVLAEHTVLREGDLERNEDPESKSGCTTMWDRQVLAAIQHGVWPDCPIVSIPRSRLWKLRVAP